MEDVWSGHPADPSASHLYLPSNWLHEEDGLVYAAEEKHPCDGGEEANSPDNNSRSKR